MARLREFQFNADMHKWQSTREFLKAIAKSPNDLTAEEADIVNTFLNLPAEINKPIYQFLAESISSASNTEEVRQQVVKYTLILFQTLTMLGITTTKERTAAVAAHFDKPVELGLLKQFDLHISQDNLHPSDVTLSNIQDEREIFSGLTILANIISNKKDSRKRTLDLETQIEAPTAPNSPTYGKYMQAAEDNFYPATYTRPLTTNILSDLTIEHTEHREVTLPNTLANPYTIPTEFTAEQHNPTDPHKKMSKQCQEACAIGWLRYFVTDATKQAQWSDKIYCDPQFHALFVHEGITATRIANRMRTMENTMSNRTCPPILNAAFALNDYYNSMLGTNFPDQTSLDLNTEEAFRTYTNGATQKDYNTRLLHCPPYHLSENNSITYNEAHRSINFEKSFLKYINKKINRIKLSTAESKKPLPLATDELSNMIIAICTDSDTTTYVIADKRLNKNVKRHTITTAVTDGPSYFVCTPLDNTNYDQNSNDNSTPLIIVRNALHSTDCNQSSTNPGKIILSFKDSQSIVQLITNLNQNNRALQTHKIVTEHTLHGTLEYIQVKNHDFKATVQTGQAIHIDPQEIRNASQTEPLNALYTRLFK